MEMNKLSEFEVKHAKPGKKEYRLSDGSGLYLVVKPNGGKLWRWSYEFNGKEKLLSESSLFSETSMLSVIVGFKPENSQR